MTDMRWDPFRDLIAIQERMNRLFKTALSASDFGGESTDVGTWSPVSDVAETDESVVVSCEVPGLSREEIDIKLTNGVLTISGERKVHREVDGDQYHRIERSYGPFQRSFTLPASVDSDRIVARYVNGVLNVMLPKRPESVPQRITVRLP